MVQEWLNWQPWKGCGVARLPRVRIPLIPPMKKSRRVIIDKPARLEDTIKLFKISKRRVAKIKKMVDEIVSK